MNDDQSLRLDTSRTDCAVLRNAATGRVLRRFQRRRPDSAAKREEILFAAFAPSRGANEVDAVILYELSGARLYRFFVFNGRTYEAEFPLFDWVLGRRCTVAVMQDHDVVVWRDDGEAWRVSPSCRARRCRMIDDEQRRVLLDDDVVLDLETRRFYRVGCDYGAAVAGPVSEALAAAASRSRPTTVSPCPFKGSEEQTHSDAAKAPAPTAAPAQYAW